jgi:NAD(P)-dependent dehydrogenase (short-subunit alcohol dehydrogenase family)
MYESLRNKVVLISGATSGIGKESALAFGKAGAKVVLSGRREAEGRAVAASIEGAGGQALFVQADVTQEAAVKELVQACLRKYGRLDIALNNAGVEWTGALPEVSRADYERVFDTNVWSIVTALKYEIPAMLASGGGSIINTSSIAGQIGMAGASLYMASKHAVEGLTKSAAMEFAKQGIRVNSVAPGAVDTEMVTRFTGGSQDMQAYMRGLHPMGRFASSREIAEPILFLASDAASFITGATLNIDGGFLAQ